MNMRKNIFSKVASVLMCVAMVGSTVAGSLPVWATGDSADTTNTEVVNDDSTSVATLLSNDFKVASEAKACTLIGSDFPLSETDNFDYKLKLDASATVQSMMLSLMAKVGVSSDSSSKMSVDYVVSGYRATFDTNDTINDLLIIANSSESKAIDVVLYDSTMQYARIPFTLNEVDDGYELRTNYNSIQLTNTYDGLVKIAYNANGGTLGATSSVSYRDTTDRMGHLDNTATKTNYVFDGWYTAANGGTKVTVDTIVSDFCGGQTTCTLYAHWKDATVTVSFETGDENLNPDDIQVSMNKPISASETDENDFPDVILRNGYTFNGWYTMPDGQGDKITKDSTVTKDTQLYAWFVVNEDLKTVTFDPNGGVVLGDDTIYVANGAIVNTLPSAERENHTFVGWYTTPTGGTKIDAKYIITSNITFYAHWKVDAVTLTYDVQGGAFLDYDGATMLTYEYGATLDSLPTVMKNGYVFKGWFTEKNGGGKQVTKGYQLTESQTIYAYFVEDITESTITFNPNGGTLNGDATRVVTTGSQVGILPEVSKAGSVFDGWYTALSGGSLVSADTKVTGDVTYYAHWTVVKVPVTSLSIAEDEMTVALEDTLRIDYTYAPANADNAVFYYTSSNPSVVKVTEGEKLEVVGVGTTTLTISTADGSVSDSVKVTVTGDTAVYVTELYFDNPEQTVYNADGVDLGYKYNPVNADNASFVWSSSDTDILQIASDGTSYKYGGKTGDVTITIATADGSISAKLLLHVKTTDNDDKPDDTDITYTVRFYTMGGSSVSDVTVAKNGSVETLPTPTRDGYEFAGWALSNGNIVTSLTNVTNDIVLYAQWTNVEEPVEEYVVVTFEAQNGTPAAKQNVVVGGTLKSLPVPTREGYTFLGWYTTSARGGDAITTSTKFTTDTTIYAQWVETATKDRYTLTLDPNGGQVNGVSGLTVADVKLESGKGYLNSIASFVPTRLGYTFNGWADENGVLVYDVNGKAIAGTAYWQDENTYIGRDLTVYAQWIQNATTYTLTYDTRGGNDVHPVTYTEGSVVTAFVVPVYAGYTFDGWYTDASYKTQVTSLTMDKDYTLYAKWTKIETEKPLVTYTVKFDSQGGSDMESVTATDGTTVELQTPVYAGYTFDGWYTEPDGGTRLISLTVSQNMTVYAHWTEDKEVVNRSVVTFDYNDGTGAYRKVSAPVGTELDALPIAARIGYVFTGWYDTAEEVEGEQPYETYVVGETNTTLYAHWKTDANYEENDDAVMFTLSFDSMSGSYVSSITVPEGELITSLPVPTREGYVFAGWYTDPSDSGDKVEHIELHADTTLYAHWSENTDDVWTVTLDDGVTTPHSWALYTSVPFNAFTTPSRDGYVFDGWYTAKDGGTQVSGSYAYDGDKDVTFYAHWTKTSDSDDTTVTETKVSHITLSDHALTVTKGDSLNLTYTYGPKDAVNASFVWTSSNEDVMKVVTNADGSQTFAYVGVGTTTLTVATADGSVSDSCKVTVKEASAAVETYVLNATLPDGTSAKITVKDTVTLNALVEQFGYSVPVWYLNGTSVDGTITMAEIMDSVGNTGSVLIGADSNGTAALHVTVAGTDEDNVYNVVIGLGSGDNGTGDSGTDDSGNTTTDNGNSGNGSTSDGTNHSTTDNSGSGNNGSTDSTTDNTSNTGTSNTGNSSNTGSTSGTSNTTETIETYELTVVSTTGATSKVTIKGNKTLAELATALGYTNVAKWAVKQANISEYQVDGTITMATLADLIAKNGDLAVVAYDANGAAIGCAKVVANGNNSYTVTLSKDTNVALRSADEIADAVDASGKGKGEGETNTVTQDGKSDAAAPAVTTADIATLPLYGAFGGMSSVLLALAAWLKKRYR